MGLTLLDLTFRCEKAFKVKVPRDWYQQLGIRAPGDDATLGSYHDFLCGLCRSQRVPIPEGSWELVLECVEEASGMPGAELSRSSRIIKDIAPNG